MIQRVERLRETLERLDAQAFLVTSPTNRKYLSGFTGSNGWLVVTAQEQFVLTDFRYIVQVREESPDFTLVEGDDLVASLAKLCGDLHLSRIAIEAAHTTVSDQQRRDAELSNITWVSTVGEIEALRAFKEPDELERIEAAVQLADEAFAYIVDRLKGRTEKEVALDLEFFMRRQGASGVSFPPIVASGPQGALPHARPTDRIIGSGELVVLDFGAIVDGYCSDMTRTVGIGPLDDMHRDIYNLVLRAQRAGVQAVRPGLLGREVDAIARRVIDEAGYEEAFGHGLGHGVGLEVHEDPPRLSKRGEATLAPGMVCSVEPGIYIPNWGGIRIEDLVVVTNEGCRVLTGSSKELIEV